MINLLKRCAVTAIKLPFSVAWDIASLGNMGEGASTSKVLAEHEAQKSLDSVGEIATELGKIAKILRDSQ